MNCKEHHLPELELATGHLREALQCILHTILFIRAPGPVAPRDVHCEGFDVSYTRIAQHQSPPPSTSSSSSHHRSHNNLHHHRSHNNNNNNNNNNPSTTTTNHHHHHPIGSALDIDVDKKVNDAIESFLRSLVQIGPELLQGCLTLGFFERRSTRQLFGLVSHEERVVWEQWVLHVVVNNTPRPVNDDSASVIERQRIQDTAEGMLKAALLKVFDIAGGSIDHVPPVMYEFEIHCAKRGCDDNRTENVYSRVANMPALINLGS